jgi:hypothetical protein
MCDSGGAHLVVAVDGWGQSVDGAIRGYMSLEFWLAGVDVCWCSDRSETESTAVEDVLWCDGSWGSGVYSVLALAGIIHYVPSTLLKST